jgi:hypothetical protein
VRLAVSVVRILADDDHLRLSALREKQRGENVVVGWVNAVERAFFRDELLELGPVWLLEFLPEQWIPVGRDQRTPSGTVIGLQSFASPTVLRRPCRTAPIDERRPQPTGRPETRCQSAMESRSDGEADRPAAW